MTTPLNPALANYIEDLCSRWAITAISANTISGSAQAFGNPPGAEAPMTTDTVISICSNTKLFVAVSLAMLVEEGKLAWTDRLIDVIPGFAMRNKRSERLVTVEDMLSHMTGVEKTNYVFSKDTMHADMVAGIAAMECNAEYKQSFIYSNAMFSLAGHLIALLSGLKMADFIRIRILEPLGMMNSGFDVTLLDRKGTTPCISLDDNRTVYPISTHLRGLSSDCAWMAAGAMLSTTNDLAKWIGYLHRTISGTNSWTDPKIISKERLQEVIKPRTTGSMAMHFFGEQGLALFPEFSTPLYALACQRFHLHGIDVVCHTGDMPGNGSLTVWTPDRDFGIVLLTNDERRGGTVMTLAALRAFELHFGIEPIDWEKRALSMPSMYATGPSPIARAEHPRAPSISLDELVGTYSSGYGDFHILASKPSSTEGLPAKAKFLLDELARAEFGGRARPDPLLIGCFDKDMTFEHYIAIFQLSGDSYWLESHQMFWSADRKVVQDFPLSVLWTHDASSLGSFSRTDGGGIAFEIRNGWSEPWSVKKAGETRVYFKRKCTFSE